MEEVKNKTEQKRDSSGKFVKTPKLNLEVENAILKGKVNSLTDNVNALEEEIHDLINNNAKLGNKLEAAKTFERALFEELGYFAKKVYHRVYCRYYD